jgi:hypothetical protein
MNTGCFARQTGFLTGISTLVLKTSREAHRAAKCNGNLFDRGRTAFSAEWRIPHEYWTNHNVPAVSHRHFHTCVEKSPQKEFAGLR